MGIYIKGVEMPKHKAIDLTITPDGSVIIWGTTHRLLDEKCTSIPEPHGRLIDESVAYDKIAEQETGYYMDMDGVDRGLQDAPTVIEAEDGETE